VITEISARLRDQVAALKLIGSALDFAVASETEPPATPAAYVMLLREVPSPSEVEGCVIQQIGVRIGVVYAIKNVADVKGAAAQVDLKALRAAGQTALLGWSPTDAEPLERGPGNLLAFKNRVLWWQDEYLTNIYARS